MGPRRGQSPPPAGWGAAITLSTVQYLLVLGWTEHLHRYQDHMDRLLATPVPANSEPPL